MRVLISGFAPFDTHKINSSKVIARRFQGSHLNGIELHSVILPVTFDSAFEELRPHIESFSPDVILCLGLAGKRECIEIEKVAINFIHSKIADNSGKSWQDQPINPSGETAFFSTLPVEELLKVPTPFPLSFSFSAGTYVCNFLMYKVLELTKDRGIKAGFIHLPHLKENEEAIFQSLNSLILSLKKSP